MYISLVEFGLRKFHVIYVQLNVETNSVNFSVEFVDEISCQQTLFEVITQLSGATVSP
jgi:hypothetical protein